MTSTDKLLQMLLRTGPLSRAALAKCLHLSRPAISSQVERLVEDGVILERGCGSSTGGKPPIILALNPRNFCAVGLDIGHSSKLRGVLCNSAGEMLFQAEVQHGNTFESILDGCRELVRQLRQKVDLPLCGIGIAVAGQVDHRLNEVVYCANFPVRGKNLSGLIGSSFNCPVSLENRARAAAKWEYYLGAARKTEDFLFLSAERGFGTAWYNNGKLFIGRAGVAGEIHDLQVPAPGGNGMLPIETALSETFLQTLENPNGYLLETVQYAVRLLVNFLDPELVVFGGKLRDLGVDFMENISENMALDPPRVLTFKLSQSGRIGAALGAALGIVIQNWTQFTKEVTNES
ncbi:MAG: ROK family transcriptional regulator [Lentisphaeria bacterium]|nr:ROK family transcriptional regulator [Lentisphaeria bacterium]